MKSNNWIATNVALFLLHPAMRLRDGLGSLEKFIQMIDFQLDRRFERNHLPDRTEYRELLAIGPELGPPGLTDWSWWETDEVLAILNDEKDKKDKKDEKDEKYEAISWPPNFRRQPPPDKG